MAIYGEESYENALIELFTDTLGYLNPCLKFVILKMQEKLEIKDSVKTFLAYKELTDTFLMVVEPDKSYMCLSTVPPSQIPNFVVSCLGR